MQAHIHKYISGIIGDECEFCDLLKSTIESTEEGAEGFLEKETGENPTTKHAMSCPKLYGQDCKCDGYHTFDELYEHRITLFIALCNAMQRIGEEWGSEGKEVWRSKLHHDGTSFDGWFIMGIGIKQGEQITYHLPLARWEETDFAETLDHAPEWDGHTPADVLKRLKAL